MATLRHRVAPALLALLLAAAPALAVDAETLPAGSPAPMFEAVDTDGKPFALADAIKEKPVLLVFWSLFCGTCREELPILEMEQPKFADRVQIVTVNLDEAPRARTVKGFAKQQGFTFRMLLNKTEGREYHVDETFKVKATPALYLINTDGTIGYGHYGALNPEELAEVVAKAK